MRLPGVVQEIADVIGREKALYLVGKLPRCYAGMPGKQHWRVILYVPTFQRLSANHQLVRLLGWKDAAKLCQFFGGEILQPSNCTDLYRPFRDAAIAKLASDGISKQTLCEWFGVSIQHVRSVVRATIPQEELIAANDNNLRVSDKSKPQNNGRTHKRNRRATG